MTLTDKIIFYQDFFFLHPSSNSLGKVFFCVYVNAGMPEELKTI